MRRPCEASSLLVPWWYGVQGNAGGAGMTELRVSKWKRHGLDRLYVNTSGGVTVAWFDRNTGHLEVKDEKLRQSILHVLAPHIPPPTTSPVVVGTTRLPLPRT